MPGWKTYSLAAMKLCQKQLKQVLVCKNNRSIIDFALLAAFWGLLAPSNLFHLLIRFGQITHFFQSGPHDIYLGAWCTAYLGSSDKGQV